MTMQSSRPLTAILWDVENVAPKEIGGIIDKIEEDYRITYAQAFADWSLPKTGRKAGDLARHNFEMIHTPHIKGLKNSADISMVAHGLGIMRNYPHITNFIIITGDADFRPLLLELKREGKTISIICDAKNAATDLVAMADEFIDYRDIIESSIPVEKDESTGGDDVDEPDEDLTRQAAFSLLEEAISSLMKENKSTYVNSGGAKTKMKLLNSGFDEQKLGFGSWSSFIKAAQQQSGVRTAPDNNSRLTVDVSATGTPKVFQVLCDEIRACKKDWDPEGYVNFSQVAPRVNCRSYGYRHFKKLALEAEKRDLVKVHSQGPDWLIKLL